MSTTTNSKLAGPIALLVMMGSLVALALVGCSRGKGPAPALSTAPPAPAAPAASAASSAPPAPSPNAGANAAAAPAPSAAAPAGSAVPAQPDLIVLAGAAFDGCKAPTRPGDPPDGQSATHDQMLVAHTQSANFNAATNDYLACLDKTETTFDRQYGRLLGLGGMREVTNIHNRIHNEAVDADTVVADKFNRQLRVYKARGGPT